MQYRPSYLSIISYNRNEQKCSYKVLITMAINSSRYPATRRVWNNAAVPLTIISNSKISLLVQLLQSES